MTKDVLIRVDGCAGRITLNRPEALNALTWDMCLQIERAITDWAADETVALVVIDASGDRAFCAGGDISDLYHAAKAGQFDYGRRFWTDEYRLNAKLARYPKPIVSLLQGFTMGGGVGLGCHVSHRVTCESSQIAMPEVSIGLVPDVGGSLILAHAPGRLGEYLGLTAARLDAADALYTGFADHFVPQSAWPQMIADLCQTGDASVVATAAQTPGPAALQLKQTQIDDAFSGETPADILRALDQSAFGQRTHKTLLRHSPLAMACAVQIIRRLRSTDDITRALELEYRFTSRCMEHGDFIEGIRAAIIDKDRTPVWQHDITALPLAAVSQMLRPLGQDILNLEDPS